MKLFRRETDSTTTRCDAACKAEARRETSLDRAARMAIRL
jgi:hypothetical protein